MFKGRSLGMLVPFMALGCHPLRELDDQREAPPRLVQQPLAGAFAGQVTALYLVPSDQDLDVEGLAWYEAAVDDVRGFYELQSGLTFDFNIQVVQSAHPAMWFECDDGDTCWGRLHDQLWELHYPLYADNTCFLVAQQGNGAHWAAAMDPLTFGGLAQVGADAFQQMVDSDCAPGVCPQGGQDGDGVTGGIAHELGHAFGLPHPPETLPNRAFSIMAEHWHYPDNGFFGAEVELLRNHPILRCAGPGCEPAESLQGSCDAACGTQAEAGCWCDPDCEAYADCCADVGVCTPPEEEGTCAGYCGSQSSDDCYCDEECRDYGDCCADGSACATCGYCD